MSRVYIILLNWNNWPDTLECLESLLQLDYPDFRIVVCDNGSTDGSLERLRCWAAGGLDVLPADPDRSAGQGRVTKPLRWIEYDRPEAEQGGRLADKTQLVVIRNGANLGFAGGNNVGLRYLLARGDAAYAWILNNDTVVDQGALSAVVRCLQAHPMAGICGSSVLSYWPPHQVDALGGAHYCRWLGLAWHLGRWRRLPAQINEERIARRMDYVVGSSMFVTEPFLREIGLMEESYFLYYEEIDWAMRSKGKFSLTYAPSSIVFHKIGGSIGTSSHPVRKSFVADYYTLRNRLKFSRRHYPYTLLTIYLGLLAAIAVRLVFRQWRKALMVYRLLRDPDCSIEKCLSSQRIGSQ